jgi:hypothetical protein
MASDTAQFVVCDNFFAWLDYASPNFSHKTACLQKPKQSKAYRSSLETLR